MSKLEVEQLLTSSRICRMALNDRPQPYLIVLDYVYFEGHMYFHFADYGRKMGLIEKDPHVSVEVDRFNELLTDYVSVTLMGRLVKVTSPPEKQKAADALVNAIRARGSTGAVAARHGLETLDTDRLSSRGSAIYRLEVDDYVALKAPGP